MKRDRTLENVETDTAELVYVGVIDLCKESDLWRGHGVVIRQEQLEFENPS